MLDSKRFEELLLAHGQTDEVAELDDFGLGELRMQRRPDGVVGQIRIPRDCLGEEQRRLFARGEGVGLAELDDVIELALGKACGEGEV